MFSQRVRWRGSPLPLWSSQAVGEPRSPRRPRPSFRARTVAWSPDRIGRAGPLIEPPIRSPAMETPGRYVGIDVAKAHLDIACLPDGLTWRVANDEAGLAALVARLAELRPALAVPES